jgi:hypothetical protein
MPVLTLIDEIFADMTAHQPRVSVDDIISRRLNSRKHGGDGSDEVDDLDESEEDTEGEKSASDVDDDEEGLGGSEEEEEEADENGIAVLLYIWFPILTVCVCW